MTDIACYDMAVDAALIDKCRLIAIKAHEGQYRRDGVTPYIEHPLAVANRVQHLGHEYECVAFLHDTIEDSGVSVIDLLNAGVPEHIAGAVWLLTKVDGVSYDDYLMGIKQNELARQVKIADMLSNLADNPTDKQIRKYSKGLLFLVD